MSWKIFLFTLYGAFTLISCGRVDSVDMGVSTPVDAYYPFGKYEWVFKTDSVLYDLVGGQQQIDSTTSFLRYRMDRRNEDWFIIQSQRKDSSAPWIVTASGKVNMENGQIVVNIGGTPLISLHSPVRIGTRWEESALASRDELVTILGESIALFSIPWSAVYDQFIDTWSSGNLSVDRAVKKISIDEDVLIERRYREEWYGEG
ncbi:MAG: hypothetical protein GVX96_05030, partial [Bacteroidetes bacterium]|nr:hypothetical protein [Bacteroidota bacterium]